MKRAGIAGIIASFVILLCMVVLLCMAVPAQSRGHRTGQVNNPRGNHRPIRSPGAGREVAPRIIGRSDSFIVSGRIVALRGPRLSIETARGRRLDFQLDEQTTLLESSGLVSIATMDDITVRPDDLRLADELEVVAERAGSRPIARIITRIARGQPVARR